MSRRGVTLTADAHQALRTMSGLASGVAERPVSMSEVLTAALPVVRAHLDELAAALAAGQEK